MMQLLPVHPLIRVACFLVFVFALIRPVWMDLIVAACILAVLYLLLPDTRIGKVFAIIARLKWFFLAVAMVYILFTPGPPLISALPAVSSTGLVQGAARVLALILLITAIQLVMQTTSRESLMGVIYWLVSPFKLLVSPYKVAVRVILTLQAVESLQHSGTVSAQRVDRSQPKRQQVANSLVNIVQQIKQNAEQAALVSIDLPKFSLPPLIQWLFPLVIGVGFGLLK